MTVAPLWLKVMVTPETALLDVSLTVPEILYMATEALKF